MENSLVWYWRVGRTLRETPEDYTRALLLPYDINSDWNRKKWKTERNTPISKAKATWEGCWGTAPSGIYMGAVMEEQQRCCKDNGMAPPFLTSSPTTSPHTCQDPGILNYLQFPESAFFFFFASRLFFMLLFCLPRCPSHVWLPAT